MIRITKLSDYGTIILSHLATSEKIDQYRSARDISGHTGIPLPMVSKILKVLVQKGLLASYRGVNGGYSLARPPERISLAHIIRALEGPIRITECADGHPNRCGLHAGCPGYTIWPRVNRRIEETLESISLAVVLDGESSEGP